MLSDLLGGLCPAEKGDLGRPWATKVRLRENVSENEPCIINNAVGHQQVPRVFLQNFHRELKQHHGGGRADVTQEKVGAESAEGPAP